MTNLSREYRLMICFAHSTFLIYSKVIISHKNTTVGDFRHDNKALVKRVFDEGLSIMNYEISEEQMNRAIVVYLRAKYNPSSVHETEIYQLDNTPITN